MIKCIPNILDSNSAFGDECAEIIEKTCPPMLYFPNVTVFFGDVYLVYNKSHAPYLLNSKLRFSYICYYHFRYDDYFVDAPKILLNGTK